MSGPEQQSSAAFLAGWANLLEEAASEGKSVFISTGDSGTSYDRDLVATNGVAVNGLSANAYNTAVGGTDFLDSFRGTNSLYWTPANGTTLRSARGLYSGDALGQFVCGELITHYGQYANSIASCNDQGSPYHFQNGVGATGGESTLYPKPDFRSSVFQGCRAMACVISPTYRCSRRTDSGDISWCSACPTQTRWAPLATTAM